MIKAIKRRFFGKAGRHANRSRLGTFLIVLIMLFFGLFSALPLILTFNQAFKPVNEFFIYPPKILVQTPTWSNFRNLLDIMNSSWVPFSRYFFNTIIISIIGTVGNVFISSLAAYPLAKSNAPLTKFLFSLVTMSLMFTAMVNDIPNYMTLSTLRLIDTYAALIVTSVATGFGLFLMRQFMLQIPDTLIEAAHIDGAGEYTVFFRIVMPNVKPAWLTLAIFAFQGMWKIGATPFVYREELKTMPYALMQIVSSGISRAGVGAAVSVVIMIFPILFFILSQSQIMETMTASGIKE